MLAIIKTGGKQYLVSPGKKIKIEKIGEEGKNIIFGQVLLYQKGKSIKIGTPFVKGVKVVGKILESGKGKKIIVFKYKAKKRYKKKTGHRQLFNLVEISKIEETK